MTSEAQRRAGKKYDAKNTRPFALKLNLKTDADIIRWLDAKENKQGAIKAAIRAIIATQPTN